MQKAFELQKEMGAVKLRLYTQDDNTASQSLYRRFGFKTNGKAVFMEAD
jgi:ribosomal protein S18 acetylase RimI-like enzyme